VKNNILIPKQYNQTKTRFKNVLIKFFECL